MERICRNCEYFDAGGLALLAKAESGDCLNPNSPRFTPEATFTCPSFFPNTSLEELSV